MTDVERDAEIDRLQRILRAGVTSSTTDGTTITYDLATIRSQLRQLEAEKAAAAGQMPPRPMFRNLGATFRD